MAEVVAEMDFESGYVRNLGTRVELRSLPLSAEVVRVIKQGGVVPMLRELFKKVK